VQTPGEQIARAVGSDEALSRRAALRRLGQGGAAVGIAAGMTGLGVAAGSAACLIEGAQRSMPTTEQIDAMMRR